MSLSRAREIHYTWTVTRVVTPADWRTQPWKNGGGVTHEIARWPNGTGDDYAVRVSLADVVQSGPFSQFAGFRRWTCLAGGGPVELRTPTGRHRLAAIGDHVELAGDVPIEATVDGAPAHLLNVIARPGAELGTGEPGGAVRFVFALATTPELARWHALLLDPPARFGDRRAIVWIR